GNRRERQGSDKRLWVWAMGGLRRAVPSSTLPATSIAGITCRVPRARLASLPAYPQGTLQLWSLSLEPCAGSPRRAVRGFGIMSAYVGGRSAIAVPD